jgi:hypothetical protein
MMPSTMTRSATHDTTFDQRRAAQSAGAFPATLPYARPHHGSFISAARKELNWTGASTQRLASRSSTIRRRKCSNMPRQQPRGAGRCVSDVVGGGFYPTAEPFQAPTTARNDGCAQLRVDETRMGARSGGGIPLAASGRGDCGGRHDDRRVKATTQLTIR